jgi:hypothetical protein
MTENGSDMLDERPSSVTFDTPENKYTKFEEHVEP